MGFSLPTLLKKVGKETFAHSTLAGLQSPAGGGWEKGWFKEERTTK